MSILELYENKDTKKSSIELSGFNENVSQSYATVDTFLENVGGFGRFQYMVILIGCLFFITPSYQVFHMIFTAYSPSWTCSKINTKECNTTKIFYEGEPDFHSRCKMKRSSWVYTTPNSYSIVSEFDLVCSRETLSYFANSGVFIGIIIGSVSIGWLSDKYGRRKSVCLSSFLLCLTSFFLSLSSTISMFIVFRLLTGVFIGGIYVTNVILVTELVDVQHRAAIGTAVWSFFAMSASAMSLQSYYIQEWRKLLMVLSIPYVLVVVVGFRLVPESIRWYRCQNKIANAENVLKMVAKYNNRKYPKHLTLEPITIPEEEKHTSFRDLFSSTGISLQTLSLGIMWFTNDILYYGISLAYTGYGGSVHRDFILILSIEIPGNIIVLLLINRFGRKVSAIGGYIFTMLSLMLFGALQYSDININSLNIVLGIFGKVFNLITWAATGLWSIELYPTSVRSQATGILLVTSQTGAAVSPWIATGLKSFHPSLPFFVLGSLPIISILVAFRLPETKGKLMHDV